MRYVYETMTHAEHLPHVTDDLGGKIVQLNDRGARMFTETIAALEKQRGQEIEVVSLSQSVVADLLVMTLLVRRPASAADPRN
jgi:hypothetical protein